MLVLVIDMGILWLLLSLFSDEEWNHQIGKILLIAIAISLLGGIAARYAAGYVGAVPSLGAYFVIGSLCLYGFADLSLRKSLAAMGGFFGFKVVSLFGLAFLSGR